jgi:hypothetical protein
MLDWLKETDLFPAKQAAEKLVSRRTIVSISLNDVDTPVASGCSKRPFSKVAASEEARRTLRYVEPLSDARTPLAVFFSILLEFLHDAFGIAGQFHVALSVNWFPLGCAGCFDGAFPIGYLCAAFGGEFLISHAGDEFQ